MSDERHDADWVPATATVAICMLTALANPWNSTSAAFVAMVFLVFSYRRCGRNRTGPCWRRRCGSIAGPARRPVAREEPLKRDVGTMEPLLAAQTAR
jgi:hypothetical protein